MPRHSADRDDLDVRPSLVPVVRSNRRHGVARGDQRHALLVKDAVIIDRMRGRYMTHASRDAAPAAHGALGLPAARGPGIRHAAQVTPSISHNTLLSFTFPDASASTNANARPAPQNAK